MQCVQSSSVCNMNYHATSYLARHGPQLRITPVSFRYQESGARQLCISSESSLPLTACQHFFTASFMLLSGADILSVSLGLVCVYRCTHCGEWKTPALQVNYRFPKLTPPNVPRYFFGEERVSKSRSACNASQLCSLVNYECTECFLFFSNNSFSTFFYPSTVHYFVPVDCSLLLYSGTQHLSPVKT